ncbi:MAG: hypothetical protein ACTS5I_12190, partial [Rhodanobacter sp.]
LLVTRRGQRSKEMTLDQLAHDIIHGHVRETPAQQESLLDRAWRGLTGKLSQPASRPRAAAKGAARS